MAEEFADRLEGAIEKVSPSGYLSVLDRSRESNGQPWTSLGERGRTEIKGITFRDLRDCFIRACYEISGLSPGEYPRSLYELPLDRIDPLALEQSLARWIAKYMGIYPDIPKRTDIWEHIPFIDWEE